MGNHRVASLPGYGKPFVLIWCWEESGPLTTRAGFLAREAKHKFLCNLAMVNVFQLQPDLNSEVLWRKAYGGIFFFSPPGTDCRELLATAVMDESLAWFPVGSSTRGTAAVASAHLYFWQVMFGVRVSCHVPWALSPSWHALFSVLVYLGPVKNTSTTPITNGVRNGVRTFQVLFDPFLAKILCNRYLDQMLAVRFHPEHHTGSIHGSFSALVGDRIMLFLFSFLLMADAKWWALVCFQRWNKHWTVASAGDAGSLVSPDLLSSNFNRTQGDVHEGWNLVITKLSTTNHTAPETAAEVPRAGVAWVLMLCPHSPGPEKRKALLHQPLPLSCHSFK